MFKKITAAALIIIFIAALVYWESLPAKPVMIKIERGTTAREAAVQMKNSGVISSEYAFLILLKISGRSNSLKAGEYALSPRTSIFNIIGIVTGGHSVRERVTIPEGFTSRQIAALLAAKKLADPGKFTRQVDEKKLEGYLFPQTYFFEPGAAEEQIINIMLDEFKKIYTPEMQQRAQELKMTEKKVVILASIIEREAARLEERPLISSVFHNRLKKGWYLESCATVLYAIGEHKEKITLKDLKVKSPYNTYICYGLPPGPICSPGLDSIKAALYPAQTQDMFFVVNGSGTHVFSRYYEEHLNNKRQYKKKKLYNQ